MDMTALQHRATFRLADGFDLFGTVWRERRLVRRLILRDLEQRYRGSVFGMVWTFLSPLIMLGLFTFVFEGVYGARWPGGEGRSGHFALLLFVGLSLFWMISDPIGRAPRLLIDQAEFVKKVVFPIDLLPWVASLSSLVGTLINLALALIAYGILVGVPPLAVLSLPIILVPLFLFGLGCGWALSALGVFIRDLQPIIQVVVTGLMFLSPIFFPLSAVPEKWRIFVQLNPVAPMLEAARETLVSGTWPGLSLMISALFLGWVWAGLCRALFLRIRHGFADVL